MSSVNATLVQAARTLLAPALQRPGGLCVLTGAGMSAESGIATFRGALTGHWSRFDPMELASEEGFRANPQRVWNWYAERRGSVRRSEPNAGHRALGDFERRNPGVLRLVTQNVDDVHQRAGITATFRLHGDILDDRWLDPCQRHAERDSLPAEAPLGNPPRCSRCNNPARPGVV